MDKNTISYYNKISKNYDSLYQNPISQAEDFIVKSRLQRIISSNHRVLDCGCGTGLARELLSDVDIKYTGLDISKGMIEMASEKFPSSSFLEGNMADLSLFDDESFDRVISINGSFSHVQEYKRAIKEFSRVLSPGGRVFLMTYNRFSIKRMALLDFSRFGTYVIRNDRSSPIKTNAVFWCKSLIEEEFSSFRDLRISGLNVCGDLLKKVLTKRMSRGLLCFEERSPFYIQRFAHALIIEAVK